MTLLGLGYEKRQGKSTVARYLCKYYGFKEFAFADPIKDVIKTLFNFPPTYIDNKEEMWPEIGFSYREACQKIGEGFRQLYGTDFWINQLHRKIQPVLNQKGNVVISDVRHVEEIEAVMNWAGSTIKITSHLPQEDKSSTHISETALKNWDKWDFKIENDSSLQDLHKKVDEIMKCHKHEKLL